MIKVWHVRDSRFRASVPKSKSDLHLVAEVSTNFLEDAFRLTNTIENPWWENEGVRFLGSLEFGLKGARSSSVGDVFERDGKFYLVASVGFRGIDL